MKQKPILLIVLLLFFCLPNLGFADCAPLGRMNHWVVQDDGSILFFAGNAPLANVNLQDCTVDSSSNIRLLAGSVCDGDEIVVNGERCRVMSLTVP